MLSATTIENPPAAPDSEPAPLPYAEQRLQQAGIPVGLLHFSASNPRVPDQHQRQQYTIMHGDKDDNLVILYPTLAGELATYDNGSKNNPDSIFERKRLKEPKTYTDNQGQEQTQKYAQPSGTKQLPFFMPGMVAKYLAKEQIPVLYFMEGEIKAAAAFARGLNVVGLPSNQIVRQSHGGIHVLESQIVALIRTCKVETVVLLHDADAKTVKWEAGKDLAKRPATFASAVVNFREVIQPLMDEAGSHLKKVIYAHGNRELCVREAKGLDDMFQVMPEEAGAILADLAKTAHPDTAIESNKYFSCLNITTPNYDRVRAYFCVERKKEQEQLFYKEYKQFIGVREFVFQGRCYFPEADEVRYMAHQDAGRFARVGSDWYKWITQPNGVGGTREVLENFKVGEIQRDYKKFPNFLEECPKFDGFTVEPNFNGEYQRVIHGNLNLITPMTHQEKEGDITNTLNFIKHLFGGQGTPENNITGDTFTVALDWLTIAHNHPKHQLPVIILVSEENKTGKSTFLKWMTWIYGSNATILNQAQFQMKFNNHYASKFFIGLDEAMQNSDKSAEKDRLKHMVTSDEIMIERKGVDLKPVPFYAKLAFTSNDANKVMKIDDEDTRWFVVKVPVLANEDVDMQAKLMKEIPAWLHFIHHRKPHHERESRLWFKPEHFITEQFHTVREATKNRLDRSIEEFIKDMFLTYRLDSFRLPVKWLTQQLNSEAKYKTDELDVRAYLKDKRGMVPSAQPIRNRIPIGLDPDRLDEQRRPDVVYDTEKTSRSYLFEVKDWLKGEDLDEFGQMPEKEEDEKPPF